MSTLTYSQEFAAPPSTIWPWLVEPERIRQWMDGVVDDRPTSEGPLGVGSTFEMDIKEGRRISTYQGEIKAYEPPRRLGLRMAGGCGRTPMTMDVEYRLQDLGNGRTRIDYECALVSPRGFFMRLMAPLFRLLGRAMVKKFFRNLARLLEQPAAQTAG